MLKPTSPNSTSADLAELLSRVAQRDRAAFAALYRATSSKLYGITVRILTRRDVADEVLQEVYVKIWERAGDYNPAYGSAISWMAAIARNRALDEVRRRKPTVSDLSDEAVQVADPGMLASDAVELSEDYRRMERCLQGLDPDKQAIVRLAYLEGWSREQLSQRFGAPVATIKTWLHRSLKQLKDCLSS
jgi:RNA polymerase sigma-70 factor (ECF subfamily)